MMRIKNMLKLFSKTEIQDDERFSLAPMREREELLCERSELSNSGEGCKDLPSPDRHPLPREGNKASCAKHTENHLFTLKHKLDCFTFARNDDVPYPLPQGAREQLSCAKHTVTNLFSYSPIHLFTSKKVAFTLAEVLITLAIIGVVAAVTMSTIKHIRYAGYAQTFLKTYSEIQQAHNNVVSKYGDPSTWPFTIYNVSTDHSGNEQIASWYMDEFKATKRCAPSWRSNECRPTGNVKWLSGETAGTSFSAYVDAYSYAALLPDGRLIQTGFEVSVGGYLWCYPQIFFTIDVNGRFKEPNQLGRDIFLVGMYKNSSGQYAIQPIRDNCSWSNIFNDSCKFDSTGFSCSENIIIDHAMKY